MCLIVLGKQIPSNHIRNGWEYGNDDGAGYAFAVNGKLTVRKPYWSLDKLLKALSADQAKHPDSTFLIHLRMTTHGTDCVENLHPMLLDNGCVIAHNGILRGFNPSDGRSDTRMFADTVLASRSRRQLMGK
jgi:glucosamine 6-phosphate synthetase-like amidotransferase/phosphosugar isomerase protein